MQIRRYCNDTTYDICDSQFIEVRGWVHKSDLLEGGFGIFRLCNLHGLSSQLLRRMLQILVQSRLYASWCRYMSLMVHWSSRNEWCSHHPWQSVTLESTASYFSLSHAYTHTYTHTYLAFSLSQTQTHTHIYRYRALSLSLSLSHTHTRTTHVYPRLSLSPFLLPV